MSTRAEINERHGVIILMSPNEANEELSEEDAEMYEKLIEYLNDFDNRMEE